MMGNELLTYFNKRFGDTNYSDPEKRIPGPVITISREVGCNGVKLARKISKRLNSQNMKFSWKMLSKEVFYESARELDIDPEKVRRIFKQDDSYIFKDILNAFGTSKFKSEKKIVKTVNDVIRTFAVDGFCIIVGRAGHIIAHDLKNALHIRLFAPLEYRIKTIMANNKLNREEAIQFIEKVEKERISFRRAIGKEGMEDDLFDICINRGSFNDEKTIDLIESAIDKKKIMDDFKALNDF